jgi:hypothetical protein
MPEDRNLQIGDKFTVGATAKTFCLVEITGFDDVEQQYYAIIRENLWDTELYPDHKPNDFRGYFVIIPYDGYCWGYGMLKITKWQYEKALWLLI